MDQVAHVLHVSIVSHCASCHLTSLAPSDYSAISVDTANQLWIAKERESCQSYPAIFISDTIPQSRPLLQNNCSTQIILRVTNRFDWMLFHDVEYHQLIQSVVDRENVWVVPNNYFEQYYARRYRNVSFLSPRYRVVPSFVYSPSISTSISTSLPKNNLTPIVINHHHDRFLLIPYLQREGIPCQILTPRQYGGPRALTNRVILHLPYQASIMSLFENWQQGVVYWIPTMRLFAEEILPLRPCCLPPDVFQLREAPHWLPFTDWYHPTYNHLFLHFDSLEELKQPLSSHIVQEYRRRIQRFVMEKGKEIVQSWRFILFDHQQS
jgi:hypothetical protein